MHTPAMPRAKAYAAPGRLHRRMLAMATAAETPPTKKKSGLMGWLVLIFLALLAIAGGFSVPMFLLPPSQNKAKPKVEVKKAALVPFGEAVVNLGEARAARFLRVKLILVVDESNEKSVNDLLAKQKPFLKSWLISYLADQTLADVGGRSGVNRIRREVRDQFNAMLFPNKAEQIDEVLFDEFVVQ
jgi:flagellar protein FliL